MSITLSSMTVAASCFALQMGSVLASAASQLNECQPPMCTDISEEQLFPLEKRVLNGLPPLVTIADGFPFNFYKHYFNNEDRKEYLRFRKDDPKDKFLFLSSSDSLGFAAHMGAERPKFRLLSSINKKFDLKFKEVKSYKEICEQVEQAAKVGKLTHVLLDANGDREKICLSDYISCLVVDTFFDLMNQGAINKNSDPTVSQAYEFLNKVRNSKDVDITEKNEFLECFKGLDPSGRITLLTSFAGAPNEKGDPKENIAQKIATAAKRTVVAPTQSWVFTGGMPQVEDFEVFDTASSNFLDIIFRTGKNAYKIFHPVYKNCVDVFKDKIHSREQATVDVVKDELSKKSTLVQPEEFDDLQDLLRFCKDDPKQKFLYLSMEADHNGASHPKHLSEILERLSKEYDLKFKTVKSYEELCNEIKEATKIGQLMNIVIHGHGFPGGIHISGDSVDENRYMIEKNWIHMKRDLAKCFEGADLSKITLFSCNTSAPLFGNVNENIANSIADATKNTVVAPVEKVWPKRIKLVSLDPFEVTHPSQCDKYGRCKSEDNTFQTIESEKKP